jgi:lysozyme family protein
MTPDYRKFVPFILRWEGGEVNDLDDSGGHTNKGITRATFNQHSKRLLGKQPTLANFKAMTREDAMKFIKHFWMKATYNNQIQSQAVAEAITSWHWGSGAEGIKQWQRMLRDQFGKHDISVDGGVGPQTVNYTNTIPEKQILAAAIETRAQTFQRIAKNSPAKAKFLRGWLNRLSDFTKRHESILTKSAAVGGTGLLVGLGLLFF